MQIKKSTRLALIVLIIACFVGMIGASLVQSSFGAVDVKKYNVTTSELADAIKANNEAYGKSVEVSFTSDTKFNFGYTLYVPKNASEATPAPAIVLTHGMYASRQMVSNGAIELSRRGYVVMAIDGAGHGTTDFGIDSVSHNTWGIEAAAEYLMSLGFVDENSVAVTGHSRGGTVSNAALTQVNENSSNHIRAYLSGSALKNLTNLSEAATNGVIFGLSDSKFEEGDSFKWKTYEILTNKDGIGFQFLRCVYPELDVDIIPEGIYYTAEGPMEPLDLAAGENMKDVETARILWNPAITHPMWCFSNIATKNTIDFFYGALGIPEGTAYMNPGSQIWAWYYVFSTIGLLAFFGLLFPVADVLLTVPLFSGLRKKEANLNNGLLSFNLKEGIIWAASFIGLAAFGFVTYVKSFNEADSVMPIAFWPYGAGEGNGIALWTLKMGVGALVVTLLIWLVRAIIYKKQPEVRVNPFAIADLSSVREFFTIVLYAVVLVALMYIPVFIAWHVFSVDFRLASWNVQAFRLIRIPSLIKYMPMFGLFYIVHAVMNAGFRYKNVPEWLSTALCALGNAIGMGVFLVIQYHSLFTQHHLWDTTASTPTTMIWNMLPGMAFAAVSTRYLYLKTKNAWVPAIVNTILMTILTLAALNFAVIGYIM